MIVRRASVYLEFYRSTRFNITEYLERVQSFLETRYTSMYKYFSGEGETLPEPTLTEFQLVLQDTESVLLKLNHYTYTTFDYEWYELIDKIESTHNLLLTIKNLPKWVGSSVSQLSYNTNILERYSLLGSSTLEYVSSTIQGNSNPQDSWVSLSLLNSLNEEEYGNGLEVSIEIPITRGIRSYQFESIVDVIDNERALGKDLPLQLFYHTDLTTNETDWGSLSYRDTLEQTILILSSLTVGSNPDLPEVGIQSSFLVGGNRALLNFPILRRDLSTNFSTDDSLTGFEITKIEFVEDNFLIHFQVSTRSGELIPNLISTI